MKKLWHVIQIYEIEAESRNESLMKFHIAKRMNRESMYLFRETALAKEEGESWWGILWKQVWGGK